MDIIIDEIVDRYVAVWSEPDAEVRRKTIADLWTENAVEFVEDARFEGHEALDVRIAEAYEAFVASGRFDVTSANDAIGHHDLVTFTIQLSTEDGAVAWAARVVLILDEEGRITRDYQVTVQALAA